MNKTESVETKPMAETIEVAFEKIRAMLASSKARQITTPPLSEKQKQELKRRWLDQAIGLRAHHPQLRAMEDAVYEFCMEYKSRPAIGRRILIYGENGTGKSHTVKGVARWAKYNALDFERIIDGDSNGYGRSPRPMFRKWPSFISDLKNGFTTGNYREDFNQARDAELLILDDVGADNDPNKFAVEHLYLLLEARETRWTIITTNIGPDAWESRFERRIASRFIRNFTHVPLDQVPDYNTR